MEMLSGPRGVAVIERVTTSLTGVAVKGTVSVYSKPEVTKYSTPAKFV